MAISITHRYVNYSFISILPRRVLCIVTAAYVTAIIKWYVSHIRMQAAKLTCVRAKLTFTAYFLDPEVFYTTYKRGYRCDASSIFESFSVPLGSSGTSSVHRDWFRQFEPSPVLQVSRLSLRVTCFNSADKTAHRIMAPLLESEYETVSINANSIAPAQILFCRMNVAFLYIRVYPMGKIVSTHMSTRMIFTRMYISLLMRMKWRDHLMSEIALCSLNHPVWRANESGTATFNCKNRTADIMPLILTF